MAFASKQRVIAGIVRHNLYLMHLSEYEFIVASDVQKRDGIGLEVWLENKLILEIFRDDTLKSKYITVFESRVSIELLEEALNRFKRNIPSDYLD